jgi:hypothetical protein
MIALGAALAVPVGCVRSVPRETVLAPSVVELEVELFRGPLSAAGMPVVSCRESDRRESRFAIDTGSQVMLVSPAYAARRSLPFRCALPYSVVGAQNETRRAEGVVRIEELEFRSAVGRGSATFRGFDALVVHTPLFETGLDGIAGAPLFAGCTFTIDFVTKVLRIEEGLIDENLAHTAPIRVERGGRIFVPIVVAGENQWALLDTGSTLFLSVPESRWERLSSKNEIFEARGLGLTIGGAESSRIGRLDGSVVIAGQTIERPFINSSPTESFSMGSGLLQGHALTVDQRGKLLRLERSLGEPAAR